MSQSNVLKLAELEQRVQSGPQGREPEAILRALEGLTEDSCLAEIETLTAELAQSLSTANGLSVAMTREKYVRALNGRIKAAARLFDAAVADRGTPSSVAEDPHQGRALTFEPPTPWPEPVDGAKLLDDLAATLRRFVVLDEAATAALPLWVLHTYCFEAFWITPRLAITSPEKRCGKTLVLTLLHHLVAKPLMSANASPAVIFRCVEKLRPTLLIDEADTFLHGKDELRGILNSGHQQNGAVLRTVGDDHEPRAFSTFAPSAIAMIGKLPDTLEDRSVAIRMARKKPGEEVERLRLDRLEPFEGPRRRALGH